MFIEWCNNNNGFLTALLSLIGLSVSIIAVIVSIRTARLPYKKRIKLSSTTDIGFCRNFLTNEVYNNIHGISVYATNLGTRIINLRFLGLAMRENGKFKKLAMIKEHQDGKGFIQSTEIRQTTYDRDTLIDIINELDGSKMLYLMAKDSEGKIYKKRLFRVSEIERKLSILQSK